MFRIIDQKTIEHIGDSHTCEEPHWVVTYYHEPKNVRLCSERIETVSGIEDANNGTQGEIMEIDKKKKTEENIRLQ